MQAVQHRVEAAGHAAAEPLMKTLTLSVLAVIVGGALTGGWHGIGKALRLWLAIVGLSGLVIILVLT